jgi:hypothetical protein
MTADPFDTDVAQVARPAWQVIEAARRRHLTAQLVLDTNPPTNVYLRDGQVYFADRSTDGGLGVRLLVEGVISREQLQRSTLQVSGVEHLGRMFERDDSIDRQAVELCVELMTDEVLTHVADEHVHGWRLQMYQRHPGGVDRWRPIATPPITEETAVVETTTVFAPPVAEPVVEPIVEPAPEFPSISIDSLRSGSIKDEVAEAVRQALACIEG